VSAAVECRGCGELVYNEHGLCTKCKKKQVREWRDNMHCVATPEFPGVDIDAIHYKRGSKRR
jgi:RNA polymerase subunit RPABC4/transcription elongation factor Spt4